MARMQKRQPDNFPNDDCLREMAKHIVYEVDGFRRSFDEWHQLSIQGESAEAGSLNRAVEVALLHYRTLLEFFRSDPREVTVDENISTDIVATDYVTLTARSISKEAEEVCETYKARIDQQLCHISTGRREGRVWREWPTGMMKLKMEGLIRQLKENLPAERAVWFSSLKTSLVEFSNEVSNGTPTVEVRPFPMPFFAPSASRR